MLTRPKDGKTGTEGWFARDTLADWYTEAYKSATPAGHLFRSRLQHIGRMISDCPGGAVLDAGCGPGIVTRFLMERRAADSRFFGIDQSPAMIDAARRNLTGGPVDLQVARIEQLPFPDSTFDVVLAIGVIEYVEAAVALGEIGRVAKPGAILVTSMLNPLSAYRLWRRWVYHPGSAVRCRGTKNGERSPRMRLYSARSFRRLLGTSHIRPVEVMYYDFNVFPPPLDRRFPFTAVAINRALDRVAGPMRPWLGTGYIVKARKA